MKLTEQFKNMMHSDELLKVVGTVTAYCALLAKKSEHKAIYLSGAGVANSSFGLPDLGITGLEEVRLDAERIINASNLPLLVDIDTGFGSFFNIKRTIKTLEKVGVAAVHIEDQISAKRCGHRPGKVLVNTNEMVDRLKACVDARTDQHFTIIARTDAYASEGLQSTIQRCQEYKNAGADAIFAEAFTELEDYLTLKNAVKLPILSNMTEFGKTPLYNSNQLTKFGVDIALYPLTAFRAMSKAAEQVYKHLADATDQKELISTLQSRDELYSYLDYHKYEQQLDKTLAEK